MHIKDILHRLRELEEKNVLVTDSSGKLKYISGRMEFPSEVVLEKIKHVPDDFEEQEFFDKERSIYFSVKKSVIGDGEETYFCYRVTDVSEYAMLVKEVASYTNSVSNMSRFQTEIMKKLSMSYDAFLSALQIYCKAEEVMMYIKKDGGIIRSRFVKKLRRDIISDPSQCSEFFLMSRGDTANGYFCILHSDISGNDCVVLIRNAEQSGNFNLMDVSVHNVIRLFIENCILRDRIVYESEHDQLTGLYNKGKYMAMKKASFGKPETIAVYNFDVNNLKHINDTYGHEYGDALIIKAAKSIAAVVSDNIFGFRMGGDEYVMVAVNITKTEAKEVRTKWKASLDRLNDEDKSLFCSMACGMSFGSGDFDYDKLYEKADKLMYKDKTELKANGITSHLNK